MKASKLIDAVNHMNSTNWANSDIPSEGEKLLRQIASHLEYCKNCRDLFDSMNYPQDTLIDFYYEVLRYDTDLSHWICSEDIDAKK